MRGTLQDHVRAQRLGKVEAGIKKVGEEEKRQDKEEGVAMVCGHGDGMPASWRREELSAAGLDAREKPCRGAITTREQEVRRCQ